MRKVAVTAGRFLILTASIAFSGAVFAQAGESGAAPIPDFSGVWVAGGFDPPPVGRGGVRMHPDYIQRGTREDNRARQAPIPPIADLTDPLLKPWAVAILDDIVTRRIAGEIIPEARSQCIPMGTPMLISEGGPRLILQTENQVTIINEELPEVRSIYLNVGHPENIIPSWNGEAVGHYEGDTLVVTTIGIRAETFVDDFLTPHTESIRVTERYRLAEDGTQIEVSFTVEDPNTFNGPWSGVVVFERGEPGADILEIRCSEYNFNVLTGEYLPMPMATELDF